MKKNMSNLYFEIFDKNRFKVWEKLSEFSDIGSLGGGTSLALQVGHRISYDFDVFSLTTIPQDLLKRIDSIFTNASISPLIDSPDELTLDISDTKVSFIHYPFKNISKTVKTSSIDLNGLNDISADKAYTIGRRGTWRDYYDLFTLLDKDFFELSQIIKFAERKYNSLFNKRLFLEQLTYFDDINDYAIEPLKGKILVSAKEVKRKLETEVKKYLKLTSES